ncbi:hypothetical protein ABIC37_005740 [Priestia megaterium]
MVAVKAARTSTSVGGVGLVIDCTNWKFSPACKESLL